MLLRLVVLCLALVSLGAGCRASAPTISSKTPSPSMPVSPPPSSAPTRQAFEDVYAQLRASFDEPTPERFRSLLVQVDPSMDQAEFKQRWSEPEGRALMRDALFPALEGTQFLQIKTEGERAAYYYRSELEAPEFLTVEVIRFRRVDGVWKLEVRRGSVTVNAKKNEAENAAEMQRLIQTDGSLAL